MADYMNVPDTAKYLDISETHLRRLVRERQIPFVYLGRRVIFPKQTLDEWMEEQAKAVAGSS
ncbi:MAG: DNA-binding protein [Spirochaetia bacterium]|nr:DNA-binding protein [Spirochaetia bacterium]